MTGFMKKATAFIAWFNTFVEETSVINQAGTSPPLGPALAKDIPEVERAVRIDPGDAVMAVGRQELPRTRHYHRSIIF